jgi:hypothetical protein
MGVCFTENALTLIVAIVIVLGTIGLCPFATRSVRDATSSHLTVSGSVSVATGSCPNCNQFLPVAIDLFLQL